MDKKEELKKLIDNPKQPTISEWVYEVEAFLVEINERNKEARRLIDGIKTQGDAFQRCENLVALLRQLYKKNMIGCPFHQYQKEIRYLSQ